MDFSPQITARNEEDNSDETTVINANADSSFIKESEKNPQVAVVTNPPILYIGSNIHMSKQDGKLLCSYSQRICNQRRLNGYAFCIRHILQDVNAPFKQCKFIAKSNGQKCSNAVPIEEHRDFCFSHLQVLGLTPKRSKKKCKTGFSDLLSDPPTNSDNAESSSVIGEASSDKAVSAHEKPKKSQKQPRHSSSRKLISQLSSIDLKTLSDSHPYHLFSTMSKCMSALSSFELMLDTDQSLELIAFSASERLSKSITSTLGDAPLSIVPEPPIATSIDEIEEDLKKQLNESISQLKFASYSIEKGLSKYYQKPEMFDSFFSSFIGSLANYDDLPKACKKSKENRKCRANRSNYRCFRRPLPCCGFCRLHMKNDKEQLLFAPCSAKVSTTTGSLQNCGNIIFAPHTQSLYCDFHLSLLPPGGLSASPVLLPEKSIKTSQPGHKLKSNPHPTISIASTVTKPTTHEGSTTASQSPCLKISPVTISSSDNVQKSFPGAGVETYQKTGIIRKQITPGRIKNITYTNPAPFSGKNITTKSIGDSAISEATESKLFNELTQQNTAKTPANLSLSYQNSFANMKELNNNLSSMTSAPEITEKIILLSSPAVAKIQPNQGVQINCQSEFNLTETSTASQPRQIVHSMGGNPQLGTLRKASPQQQSMAFQNSELHMPMFVPRVSQALKTNFHSFASITTPPVMPNENEDAAVIFDPRNMANNQFSLNYPMIAPQTNSLDTTSHSNAAIPYNFTHVSCLPPSHSRIPSDIPMYPVDQNQYQFASVYYNHTDHQNLFPFAPPLHHQNFMPVAVNAQHIPVQPNSILPLSRIPYGQSIDAMNERSTHDNINNLQHGNFPSASPQIPMPPYPCNEAVQSNSSNPVFGQPSIPTRYFSDQNGGHSY